MKIIIRTQIPYTYKAFTLIELLVSMAVISILTGVLFAKYPDQSIRLNLINVTQDVALLIREAQIRGSAVDSKNKVYGGYGAYFALANPNRTVLFSDIASIASSNGINVGDSIFDTTPTDETSSTVIFPRGYTIKKLCVLVSGAFTCNDTPTPPITSLTISFIRPNPEPRIYVNNDVSDTSAPYQGACIELWSIKGPQIGHVKTVRVLGIGFIQTSKTPCE